MKILITKDAKIILTEEEYIEFKKIPFTAPFVEIKGQDIRPPFISGIYDLDFYIKQEADQLKPKGLRRCKHCGDIVNRADPCACKDNPELREKHPFKIANTTKKLKNGK